MKDKIEKTNAIRILQGKKINFKLHTYDNSEALSGVDVAAMLNLNADKVFKTLVTVGKSGNHYVFMIPVAKELDLKKAAKISGEKSIEMIKSKDLLGLTGYIHGGCSPVGMKKIFTTYIHNTAHLYDTIIFSGGKIGLQLEMPFEDLKNVISIKEEDVIVSL